MSFKLPILLMTLVSISNLVQGEATWYDLPGNLMRNEKMYDSSDPTTVAVGVDRFGMPIVPLGSWLAICPYKPESRHGYGISRPLSPNPVRSHPRGCYLGMVQDTGLFPTTDLDLSPAAFQRFAPLAVGRIEIEWQEVKLKL